MADISSIIILVTLFVIFGVFLAFDLFGRNENYSYLAYIVAVIPVNFFWGLGYDPLFAYIILFALWDITLIRDTIAIYLKKKKEINQILLYLALGILVQLIISAILPEIDTYSSLKNLTDEMWFFWLPDVHSAIFHETVALGFKIAATIMVLLIIIPLIIDIKDEEATLPIIIVFVAIFILPFLYLSFIWIPEAMGVLTFLFSVLLFIILLIITKSGNE
ncbi:hypothetical protein LCGC14_0913040 [marine sediment metagenome]|uniref:Uncharacterized protein n=1 Tax=marine sediment metagenome TaxID=412755 RepID=A0A0F9PDS8_9ZZZZ